MRYASFAELRYFLQYNFRDALTHLIEEDGKAKISYRFIFDRCHDIFDEFHFSKSGVASCSSWTVNRQNERKSRGFLKTTEQMGNWATMMLYDMQVAIMANIGKNRLFGFIYIFKLTTAPLLNHSLYRGRRTRGELEE